MVFDAIPKWVLAAIAAVFATTSCKLKFDKDGLALEVEKVRVAAEKAGRQYEYERSTAAQKLAQAHAAARETEQALNVAAAKERERAERQVAAARADADRLRGRLLAAATPPRAAASLMPAPAAAPPAVAFGPGTLGAQLSASAGDLVGEAQRAEVLRAALIECRAAYESAAGRLSAVKSQTTNERAK